MKGVVGFYHKFRDLIDTLTDDEKTKCFKDADYLCNLSGWSNNKQGVILGYQMCYAAFKNMGWHDIKDKAVTFPASSYPVLVCNINLPEYNPARYSIISVEKLLTYIDKPMCSWTHWMEIPECNIK